jgi:hypothetical protein
MENALIFTRHAFPRGPGRLLVSAFSALAADVSGMWQPTIDTRTGKAESSLELMREDGKLNGTIQNGKSVTIITLAGKITCSEKKQVESLRPDARSRRFPTPS